MSSALHSQTRLYEKTFDKNGFPAALPFLCMIYLIYAMKLLQITTIVHISLRSQKDYVYL